MMNKLYLKKELCEKIFKNIFNKYSEDQKWLIRATKFDPRDLAHFGDTEKNVNFLKNVLDYKNNKKSIPHFTTIFNALLLLRFMKTALNKKKELEEIILDIILNYDLKEEKDINHTALITLTDLKLNNKKNIRIIITRYKKDDKTWIRSALYYMLINSKYLDENIDIFLDGIEYLKGRFDMNPKKTRLGDESYYLWMGLEKINKPVSIKKVINFFIDYHVNNKSYHNIDFHIREYFLKITENLIYNYYIDKTIYNYILKLLEIFDKSYLNQYSQQLIQFFNKTKTTKNAFQYFYNLFKKNKNKIINFHTLAMLTNENISLFLLEEYRNKKINSTNISYICNTLDQYNTELYVSFSNQLIKISNGEITRPKKIDYKKEEQKSLVRYVSILFNKEKYIDEIKRILDLFDEENISFDSNIIYQNEYKYLQLKNYIKEIYFEFQHLIRKEKSISKEKIINKFEKKISIYFWINEIYTILSRKDFKSDLFKENQQDEIKKWCLNHINKINFKSAITKTDKGFTINNNAIIIFFFMKKFRFEFSKNIMLDMLSFDTVSYDFNGFQGIEYIDYYIDKVYTINDIEERVKENFKKGFKLDFILKNHVELCFKYNIFDENILYYLKSTIVENYFESSTRKYILKSYFEYYQDINKIEILFKEINDSFKWDLLDYIIKKGCTSDKIQLELLNILKSNSKKEKVKAAEHLIYYQNIVGINYYIDNIIKNKKMPEQYFDWNNALMNIKNKDAVPKLLELLLLDLNEEIKYDDFYHLSSQIYQVLKSIGSQSEKDFIYVRDLLKEFIKINDKKFLNQIIDEMEQQYYINKEKNMSMDDVKKILDKLEIDNEHKIIKNTKKENVINTLINYFDKNNIVDNFMNNFNNLINEILEYTKVSSEENLIYKKHRDKSKFDSLEKIETNLLDMLNINNNEEFISLLYDLHINLKNEDVDIFINKISKIINQFNTIKIENLKKSTTRINIKKYKNIIKYFKIRKS